MKKLIFIFLLFFGSFAYSQTTSEYGISLIKTFESCRKVAYRCPANVWTIGYGHTVGVYPGMQITRTEADAILAEDLSSWEKSLTTKIDRLLPWNEFDACIAFTYNLGKGIIRDELQDAINEGNTNVVVNKVLLYDKARNPKTKKLEKLRGLTRRRYSEAHLYKHAKLKIYKIGEKFNS